MVQNKNIVTNGNNSGDEKNITGSVINCPTVLSGMSHEVRTQMNAIVAFSFLMNRNGCKESERDEFSRQILSSCESLIGLFDNFLDSAILETGNPKADLKICRLGNLLDDLLSEFRETIARDDHKDIELVAENGITDSISVCIDINRVFRVLRSLFQNALNNTKSGYIKVGYYFRDNNVTFYVLDSGQGFFKSREYLSTEDFNKSLSLFNDTGAIVNLALARKIVQLLDGSIRIECNGLTGSGIYFAIPVKIAESSGIPINRYLNSTIAI